jgi:hypothetical protein
MNERWQRIAVLLTLALPSLLTSCTRDDERPRLKGVLKIKYTPAGKPYKACCQGPYGSGTCSEFGSLYTISYDLFNSDPGDPCTYSDLYAKPSPTPDPSDPDSAAKGMKGPKWMWQPQPNGESK